MLIIGINDARSKVMSNKYYKSNKVSSVGIGFMFTGGITFLYTIYISCISNAKIIKNSITKISEIDRILEKLDQDLKYVQSIIYQILTQFIPFVIIFMNAMMQTQNIRRERFQPLSTATLFVFVYPAVVINVFQNHYAYTILLVKQRFAMINEQLMNINLSIYPNKKISIIKELEMHSKISVRKIGILMKVHDDLCDITEEISKTHTLPITVNLAIQYGTILFTVFYCYWMFSLMPNSSISWMVWSFLKMSEVLHVSISSHLTSLHAKFTSTVVHKLLLKTIHSEVKNKLINFSNQLMFRDVKFTIWGMFTMDATLLFTMITAAASYITIMIQFQQASLPVTCKTALNYTKE
ncbi:hypothetical protein FQA39_LY03333 [Lamprigera yunnana]|nr:hypothetical protein FQA39_LY03333 [Lamprigera yunnana]